MTVVSDPRGFLASLFKAAVDAADPLAGMRANLPPPPKGRTIVIGAGKAAARMAEAFESLWDAPVEGIVVDRHGTSAKLNRLQLLTAAHPVPDEAGLAASEALLKSVRHLTSDDLVIALISGGGSALLPAPLDGLLLTDEIDLNKALLASGAPISAMNSIRKCFSRIKGGRLAREAAPARVVSFVVSDIPGDDPSMVASGPTIADNAMRDSVRTSIETYDVKLPKKLLAFLQRVPEAPSPADPAFAQNRVHLIASANQSLLAASARAEAHGIACHVLSDAIEGEAREVAAVHAALACYARSGAGPFGKPCVILSGGETTVTIGADRPGKGGRNTEFVLSLARRIAGSDGIHCLAADTDGIDGTESNAGGFADATTVARMISAAIDPAAMLKSHDSWTALHAAGDLFVTGPTGTNVNDFRAMLII